MKHTIRLISVALAALLFASAFGCLVRQDAETPTAAVTDAPSGVAPAPNVSRNRDAVAVELGDVQITAGEIEDMYNSYIELFSYYGTSAPTDEESIAEYVQMSIEDLLTERLPIWKAKETGVELTEAELDKIDQDAHYSADEEYESLITYYASYYTDAGDVASSAELTPEQLEETLHYLNDEIREYYNDPNADIDVYISEAYDYYYQEGIVNAYVEKLRAVSDETVVADDAAVEKWYEDTLAEQKETFDGDPTMYRTSRESTTGDPLLYVPEGLAVVKLIKSTPEGEAPAEISENNTKIAEYEAEYGKIALSGGDEAKLEEIRAEYAKLVQKNEELREAYYGDSVATVNGILEKLRGGASIDEAAPDASEQILCLNGSDWEFAEEVQKAAAALQDGAYSDVITVGNAVYLVYMVGRLTPGAVDRAPIEDAIRTAAKAAATETAWNELQDAWKAEALEKAVYHKEAYAYVGK